jgi:hypothetical protein
MSVPSSQWRIQPRPGRKPGELGENDKWWAERQKALEQAGYMLRPRYHSDREPSWAGTNKFYLDFEDGQPQRVSTVIFYYSTDDQLPQQPLVPSGYGCGPDL